jgi:phage anti-repressor protein
MNELIKVTETNGKKAVSAQELYLFLSIDNGSNFSKWAKVNIEEIFTESVDYQNLRVYHENGGRPLNDFALTLDCAKHISMMSRCENGKKARQYFIECEKQLAKPMNQFEFMQLQLNMLKEQSEKIEEVKKDVQELKAKSITTEADFYSIVGYASLNHVKVDRTKAQALGIKAGKLSRQLGVMIGRAYDAKYGAINTYHKDILSTIFNA